LEVKGSRMMFKSLWEQLTKKDNRLANPETKIEITADNLKRLVKQFYDKGYDNGRDASKGAVKSFKDIFEI